MKNRRFVLGLIIILIAGSGIDYLEGATAWEIISGNFWNYMLVLTGVWLLNDTI